MKPNAFLRRHWQKRPLFVRQAMPGFRGAMDLRSLLALAARPDTESRRVQRRSAEWETRHGPFPEQLRLKARNDSLLVSGVNLHVAAADALLREFAFIPQARLDDVMVSYATPGGGVGPHVDSYDVFLLQGAGRRRWRFWPPGKPRKDAMTEVLARAGDLLYLPPGWLHDGVALDPCFTYSIGFRAPRGAELAAAFLDWLHERGLPDAPYRDPRLVAAAHPGAIPANLRAFAKRILDGISWSGADVLDFLGRYLTEPKAHVVFRPSRAGRSLERSCLRLDPKTQFLYCGRRFFINGESFSAAAGAGALRELADRRSLAGRRLASHPLSGLVSQWLRAGYAHLEKPPKR
ncbi:MAG TPA: cupin domain-containing protein [Burkholderiales bacterium]|nr:cupin domain-containing protein [Burkholderiales bacterium]